MAAELAGTGLTGSGQGSGGVPVLFAGARASSVVFRRKPPVTKDGRSTLSGRTYRIPPPV